MEQFGFFRRRFFQIRYFILFFIFVLGFQNCSPGFKTSEELASLSVNSVNNNGSLNLLGLSVSSASGKQGDVLEFQVNISTPQSIPLNIEYETSNGTGIQSVDFIQTRGSLVLPAGQTSLKVPVATLSGALISNSKNFGLQVRTQFNGSTITQNSTAEVRPGYFAPKFKSISAGWGVSCGILLNGNVACWGLNIYGQAGSDPLLGNVSSGSNLAIPGLQGAKSVHAGSEFSCAVTAQDTVKCWGSYYGMGTGSMVSSHIPVDIPNLGPIKMLSVKSATACAITVQDTVKCWGQNYNSQMGNGQAQGSFLPVAVNEITALSGAKWISVGYENVCVVTAQNQVQCAGSNLYGQLGSAATVGVSSNIPITVQNLNNVAKVSAGNVSACAILLDGTVRCWGLGTQGQLGNNTIESSSVPVQVIGLTNVVDLISDLSVNCAITNINVKRCWGSNTYKVLNDLNSPQSAVPVTMTTWGNAKLVSISANYGCSLNNDDTLNCWGSSIPTFNFLDRMYINAYDKLDLIGSKEVKLGRSHHCSITSSDTLKCWGLNNLGQLGNNSQVDSNVSVDVIGLVGVKAVALSSGSTCALLTAGNIKCWGSNDSLQLGSNQPAFSTVPIDVPGISGAKYITASNNKFCIITAQDTVSCWGSNSLPAEMAGLSGITSLSMGYFAHSCAVNNLKTVKCWGNNNLGQLGNNSTASSTVPVDVVGLQNVKSIGLAYFHSCALLESGNVKCWGYNDNGQLGNNSVVTSTVPVDVVGLTGVTEIAIGPHTSCALDTQKQAKCWGFNSSNISISNAGSTIRVPVNAFDSVPLKSLTIGAFATLFSDDFGRFRIKGSLMDQSSLSSQLLFPSN